MTAREVLQRLVDAMTLWDAPSISDALAAARAYLAQPEPQDEARDAARYRWLRDNGTTTWIPLAKRYKASAELDRYIDAAIAAQENESAK